MIFLVRDNRILNLYDGLILKVKTTRVFQDVKIQNLNKNIENCTFISKLKYKYLEKF
jgi:hypothetical protein